MTEITSIGIGGLTEAYEAACQRMLIAGLNFMEKNPDLKPEIRTLKNVTGIAIPDNEDGKRLTDAIAEAVPDCTGAMMQVVLSHVFFITKNGREKWLAEAGKSRHVTVDSETGEVLRGNDESRPLPV